MRAVSLGLVAFLLLAAAMIGATSCGGSNNGSSPGASTGDAGDDGTPSAMGFGSTTREGGSGACPYGLQCDVPCANGGTSSVSGTVYDPAGLDPLYNVMVFVAESPLQALDVGVPTGADACSCPALFKSGSVTTTTTDVDGKFTLKNVPVGDNVPFVIQVGKWRRQFLIHTVACQDTPFADKVLTLPSTVPAGDIATSMPQIAVSTGSADSLECLMHRIGLPKSEYVAGAGGTGHVHLFAGGQVGGTGAGIDGSGPGSAETPGMAGAPSSYQNLWDSQAHLMPYDIVLLSCEGGETYNANPPALEAYLNAGGRVFASHYQYPWLAGPIASKQSYSAPSDWVNALATWTPVGNGGPNYMAGDVGGDVVTTLSGSSGGFPKGQALDQWLGNVGALGASGVGNTEVSIFQPRYNAQVTAANKPSQPWIAYDDTSMSPAKRWSMYFSFDTPINPPRGVGETLPKYCGRAVYSDLHVAGDPKTTDTMSPPGGCADGPLSPQEKVLE
ncbi:MAG: hypothetical protein ACREJ3_20055, partial [Polyangiaceae bacterium]